MTVLKNKGMDKLSYKILKALCENARISNAEIGRQVGLSPPAVGERIQKLEQQGFITGHHTAINFDKMGLTIQAFINFKATTVNHDELLKIVEAIPEIIEWHVITGTSCMLMKVAAFTSKELEAVIVHLNKFGETSTSLILSRSSVQKGFGKIFS